MGILSTIFGTKLTKAADMGDSAVVEQLLKKGSDPNERQMGITALIMACNKGYVDVVRLLVEKGADVNAKDWEGLSPLMAATAGGGHVEQGNKEERCLEIVKLLIAHGADVDQKSKSFQAALKHAEDAGYKRVKEILVRHGETK